MDDSAEMVPEYDEEADVDDAFNFNGVNAMRNGFEEGDDGAAFSEDKPSDESWDNSDDDGGDGYYDEIEMAKKETVNIYDAKFKIPNQVRQMKILEETGKLKEEHEE